MAIQFKTGYKADVTSQNDSNGFTVVKTLYCANDDTANDMEMRILTDSQLPVKGSAYSSQFTTLILDSISCEAPNEDFVHWEVRLTYKTFTGDSTNIADPTLLPANVKWVSFQKEKLIDKAYGAYKYTKSGGEGEFQTSDTPDYPIQSTSGEPFQLAVNKSTPYIEIQTYQNNFDPEWLPKYENTILLGAQRIAGMKLEDGQAYMKSINGEILFKENGDEYYNVTIQINIDEEGFDPRPINRGYFHQVNSAEDKLIEVLNEDFTENTESTNAKDPVPEPVKLDEFTSVIPQSQKKRSLLHKVSDKQKGKVV